MHTRHARGPARNKTTEIRPNRTPPHWPYLFFFFSRQVRDEKKQVDKGHAPATSFSKVSAAERLMCDVNDNGARLL